jgi:hypothetical protein
VSAGDNLQAYNRYSYVWNNPLNATDPSGYEPVSGIFIAIAAAIGAEASYAVYIAYQIYSVYSIVQGVYGAIQAFKYDQGLGGVLALAQAAYSGYNLYNAGGWGKASWEARTGNSGVSGVEADNIMAANANVAVNGGGEYVPEASSFGRGDEGLPLDRLYADGYAPDGTTPRIVALCLTTCQNTMTFSEILQTVIPAYGVAHSLYNGNYVDAALSGIPGGRVAKSAPIHHLCTNKNCISSVRGGPWTPRFEEIFKKAGLDLDDAINKVAVLGHKGPHPEAYHSYMQKELLSATRGLKANTAAYTNAVTGTLNRIGAEATTVGSQVNRWLTKQ